MGILLAFVLTSAVMVLLLSVVVFVVLRRAAPLERARGQAIAALCARRGLRPGTMPSDFAMLGPIDPHWLANGYSSSDRGVAVADYCRSAGNHLQCFSLLAFTIPGLNVPYVAATRRDLIAITPLGGPPVLELESTEFDERFMVRAHDRRSAVMLLDPGMMQWLLDCGQVNFEMTGDRVLAFVNRAAEPVHQPAEPVEFEQLFKFWDGFVARVPELLRTEYAVTGVKDM